jgi:DNA-binding response OmpR family regulator
MATKKVLIVDDDPDIRSLYRLALRQEGLHILEAGSGAEALKVAEREQPHLVLLDIMMPEMDGFEVCRRLRANPETAEMPVLMFSAKGTGSARRNGMLVGANDFMTKSVGPRALVERIRFLLSGPLTGGESVPFPITSS